jgi:hypothetical protein
MLSVRRKRSSVVRVMIPWIRFVAIHGCVCSTCCFFHFNNSYLTPRNVSGLPFFDVMLLENLPKSASLPVATSQETKRRIREGIWDFDYIFYTESDQVCGWSARSLYCGPPGVV